MAELPSKRDVPLVGFEGNHMDSCSTCAAQTFEEMRCSSYIRKAGLDRLLSFAVPRPATDGFQDGPKDQQLHCLRVIVYHVVVDI